MSQNALTARFAICDFAVRRSRAHIELERTMMNIDKAWVMRCGVTIAAAVIVGGFLVGGTGPVLTGNTPPHLSGTTGHGAGCAGGTDVSAFVCRNTWMALTRHAVR